jgi:hypothetical protein
MALSLPANTEGPTLMCGDECARVSFYGFRPSNDMEVPLTVVGGSPHVTVNTSDMNLLQLRNIQPDSRIISPPYDMPRQGGMYIFSPYPFIKGQERAVFYTQRHELLRMVVIPACPESFF